jgi:hypothetical protein
MAMGHFTLAVGVITTLMPGQSFQNLGLQLQYFLD